MEIEKYKVLLTAIEKGTLSETAEQLGYTPSGVSRMMVALEAETGFPLLARSRGGVVPTRECEELLPTIREMVRLSQQYNQMAAAIMGLETGTITIGNSYGAYYRKLIQVISRFCEAHPGIQVNILEGASSKLDSAIRERQADFCIMSRRDGDYDWIHLRKDEMVVIVSKDHPLAGAEAFPIKAFETEPYIEIYPGVETDCTLMFQNNGITPNIRYSCNDTLGLVCMVESGMGIGSFNALIAEQLRGDVVALPIDPPQYVDIGIGMPSLDSAPPAVKEFVEYAKEAMKEE